MGYSICLIAGISLLILALSRLRKGLRFLRSAGRAMATVIEVERFNDSEGDLFQPVYQFTTELNQEYLYRPPYSSSPSRWETGDELMIIYHPDDPSIAKPLTYFGVFGWSIVLMAISMPLLVIGGGYYIAQHFLK